MLQIMPRWERRGWEKGVAEGRLEGQRTTILQLLEQRWGPLDEGMHTQIAELGEESLDALTQALFSLTDLAELERWLARHAER